MKRPTFSDIFPDLPETASSLPPVAKVCRTSSPADSVEDLLGDSEEEIKEGKRMERRKDRVENKDANKVENKDSQKVGRRGRESRRTSND